ncbi:MAG: PTS sugar transporter subunit IIA [Candidatus Aminicenantes bacterium]|nr:MAG: PTS sugar transporter subunit IIA [Candidatus Aminicenantes bacterium]
MHDMIITELEYQDRESVLKEMVNFLKKKDRISKEKELYEKLLQREELGSTAIGEGVAIPHCKIKGVKDSIVMLAISKEGVNFQSTDGKPSHVFFLVVSSPDNPSVNLQILAAIAHLIRKSSSLMKKILKAKNVSAILDVIHEEEKKLDG